MWKILALDYGTKKTGIAISDSLKMLARPVCVFRHQTDWELLKHLQTIQHTEWEIELILIGDAKSLHDGKSTPQSTASKQLETLISKELGCPVRLIDERFTSIQAHAVLRQQGQKTKNTKDKVDAVAAVLILQLYLDTSGKNELLPRFG